MATSVRLDDDLKSRIQHLAEVRNRSATLSPCIVSMVKPQPFLPCDNKKKPDTNQKIRRPS